ncbi:peptide deformylase, partial [Enterococcus faecalis]|uniref:peptide deformylase n=1 Tax=Enterococcus faecalis TaxID=1351 RepID=UPI003D6AFFDC
NKKTDSYIDMAGEKHKERLKNYEAKVDQHEKEHINGKMFYDQINKENPLALKEGVLVIV